MDLFRDEHIPQTEFGPSQKAIQYQGMRFSVFIGVGNFIG